jgi:hypothetical protein
MSIVVTKIWTEYKPDGQGSLVGVDMVSYAPIGEANRSVTIERVSKLAKVLPPEEHGDNWAAKMAYDRWQVIGAAYEAFKKGQEAPTEGTPIGAWPGLTPEQANIIRGNGIRTVEELADAGDSIITRIPLPGMRAIKDQAQLFLKAADQTKLSTEMAKKDQEIGELRAQMEELMELVKNGGKPESGEGVDGEDSKQEKAALQEHATSLGIEVDKRWSIDTLITKINEVEGDRSHAA